VNKNYRALESLTAPKNKVDLNFGLELLMKYYSPETDIDFGNFNCLQDNRLDYACSFMGISHSPAQSDRHKVCFIAIRANVIW